MSGATSNSGTPTGLEAARALKSGLAARIVAALDRQGLTVREAEARTGQAAADFSRLRGGKLDRFTIDRLMGVLAKLDQQVEVEARTAGRIGASAGAGCRCWGHAGEQAAELA